MDIRPLRIGFVMLHTSPLDVPGTKDAGGMNVVVHAQAEALARAGHDVRIYTRRADPAPPARVELEFDAPAHAASENAPQPNPPGALTVIHLDAGPARLLAKGEHEALIDAFGERLAGALAEDPVDVLHAEHWFSGVSALPVARSAGVPLVQSYHSIAAPSASPLGEGERAESPGRLEGERHIAHQADLVIAVSEAERRTAIDRLGADPARVAVVHLGVDTELFHPCGVDPGCAEERRWRESGGRPEALVVGRLHPLKGFDLAIEAIAEIPADLRPALRIVGSPPPDGEAYARRLHELVARHGMLCTTSFEGALRRSALAERTRRADLMLIPSHSETFGLVALEASASGIPVIARAAGGLVESVVDGETGLLVPSSPAESDGSQTETRAWARAIEGLITDPDRMKRLGAQGRKHALTRTWDDSAASLGRVYRDLLSSEFPPSR